MAPPRHSSMLLDDPRLLTEAYASATLAELGDRIGVSAATVRRALIRHGISSQPRNRNRRPRGADVLDDGRWLADRYRTRTGVEIARELGVSPRTVYAAMERHGIVRRVTPGQLALRRPELTDSDWLHDAVERNSSTDVASALAVSAGSVTNAYRRTGIDPASTPRLYVRGRAIQRPSAARLRSAWKAEGSVRGVARQFGIAHNTATVWLAEIGVFVATEPALGRSALLDAIAENWPMTRIASECGVSVSTVRVELHRHGLFDAHRNRHRVLLDAFEVTSI